MAGFRNTQRRLDRLEISHFSDQHDIGVLAEGCSQGRGKTAGVDPHFPLVDDPLFVRVEILDRILDREDVTATNDIDRVDQCGQRCRLSAPGRSGHEHQASWKRGKISDDRGQA